MRILERIEKDNRRWEDLSCSWISRANIVKSSKHFLKMVFYSLFFPTPNVNGNSSFLHSVFFHCLLDSNPTFEGFLLHSNLDSVQYCGLVCRFVGLFKEPLIQGPLD